MGFIIENNVLTNYAEKESVTEVIIPDSVTSIDKNAFYNCKNLTNIVIPSSVTSIGDGAFAGCENLTNIYIPYGVTSIDDDAFKFCENLVILCSDNSYAKEYAIKEGIEYKLIK